MNGTVMMKIDRFKATIFKAINGHQYGERPELQSEGSFNELLRLETKRSERSKKTPLLMLLDVSQFGPTRKKEHVLSKIESVLLSATREIDLKGWYKFDSILGVLFTETEQRENREKPHPGAMIDCMRRRLCNALDNESTNTIKLSCFLLSCTSAKPALTDSSDIAMSKSLQ
jgi:hypothetical protein